MFSKLKKLFTVLAVTMMVASSLPLNVLADTTEPSNTENVMSNSSEVQNETTNSTSSSEEVTTPSSEAPVISDNGGTPSQPNAPNETTASTTEASTPNADSTKADLASKLAELGLQYHNNQLTIINGSSYLNPEIMDRAISLIKDSEGTSGSRRRVLRAVSNTIWVDTNTGNNNVKFTRKGVTEWGWYMKRDSDGQPLWCIEPTVPLGWGANGGYTRGGETSIPYVKASLVAYFGYFKQPSVMNAFYTEMLIGEVVSGFGPTAIWNEGYSMAGYNAFKNAVLADVETFWHQPTFAGQTVTVKAGESVTLTDTEGRLRNYVLRNSGGLNVQRNGNSITISTNANSPENSRIRFGFDIPLSYGGATLVYRNPYSQDVISAHVGDPTSFDVNVNVLKNGKGKIIKKDQDGNPLANVVFEAKNVANGETRQLTTNENGEVEAEWAHGTTLEIREVQAPNGYVRDNSTKTLQIEANQTKTVEFSNKKQLAQLTLIKQDAETGDSAQGKSMLNGAVYGLFKEDGTKVTEVTLNKAENGKVQGTISNLPLGNYYVQEIKAPNGYNLNEDKINVALEYQGQDVEVAVYSKTVKDQVIKGSIKGYKFGNKSLIDRLIDLFNGNGNIKNPLSDVELTAKSYTTGKTYKAVTNKDGYFEINNLPYDKYQLSETKGKAGYRLIAPFDFEINAEGQVHTYLLEDKVVENKIKVVKVDSETGKAIALSKAQFKIYDRTAKKFLKFSVPNTDEQSEILTTNDKGYLVTSEPLLYGVDRYELHEVKAPEGYVLSTKPTVFSVNSDSNETIVEVKMANMNQKGKLTVHKSAESAVGVVKESTPYGEITKFTFNQQAIAGVQFKVRAAKDIVTNDGTVRLAKGQFVQSNGKDLVLTTNAQGQIQSPALYLGSYELVEVSAPAGVVTLANPIAFELTYSGQDKELTVADKNIENDLQTVRVPSFKKRVERVTGFKDGKAVTEFVNAGNEVVYALRLKNDVQLANTVIAKGTVLAYAAASDGRVAFSDLKLPRQSVDLEVVEVRTQHDLVLNTTTHTATYTPTNNEALTDVAIVKADQQNRLARTNVELFKYDTAFHLGRQNAIKDVPFELVTNLNGKEVVIGQYKTNAEGKIKVDNLPTGSYFFREVKALPGYATYKENIPFNVSVNVDGQTIKVSAENKRLPIEIGTQATFENEAKVLNPFKENKLVDTIKFTNLMVGKSYIWKTKIVEYGNPNKVIKEFDTPFVADKMNGEFKIQTSVDGSQLRGKKITFMETLVDGEVPTHIWSEHNNPKDEGQSVRITNPQISTQATFENGLKEMNPFKENELVDTVKYTDVTPDREYKLVTKLVEWGNPTNVIAEKTENFTPKSANKVHLTVDGTKLRGKKVVFLEYLYDNEKPSEEQAKHENPKDEGQSVRFTNPAIGTKATFENRLKEMNPFKENVIVDTISYKDLVPGRKYRVVTKLVEADVTIDQTGKVKDDVTKELDENVSVGTEVSEPKSEDKGTATPTTEVGTQTDKEVIFENETFFTPTQKSGEYKVTIKVDGTKLSGKTVVFYEYLYDNEKPTEEQAKHENPKDEGQSVRFTNPSIGTQAHGYKGEEHKFIQPVKEMSLIDKIKYEDVTVGREYRVVTKLIEFGNPNNVIKETE